MLARASRSRLPRLFDIGRLARFATVLRDSDGEERVSLSNGIQRIGLCLLEGSVLDGPVALRFVIDDARLGAQMIALSRFRALRERRAFGAWLHRPETCAPRWIKQLRAYDGWEQGASDREIALALFGRDRVADAWRDRDNSLRSAVRRLIAGARRNVIGDYKTILGKQ